MNYWSIRKDMIGNAPIFVWPFDEAPESLKLLSTNGGDENWLALVPKCYTKLWIPWLDDGGSFGVYKVYRHELENGSIVFIGAHS